MKKQMKKHILQENYERFFGKREFGDPLPTFEDVMKKHQENKLKEDWWDNMDSASQAAYIKKHPGSKQAQQADDEPEGGEEKGKKSPEKRMAQIDNERESLNRQWNRLDQPGMDKSGEGKAEVMKKWDALDAEYDELEGGEEPSGEPEDEPSDELPDKVDSSQDASELYDKLDSIQDKYSEIGSKWDEKLDKLSSIDVDEITDEQIEEMGEAGREMSRNYKASSITREMMSIDVSDEEGLEEFNDLLSNLNKQSSSPRTGTELNQETLTIDGKQFRRISEGVEKQPKPKYEFSEFYQRFKRQE